MSQLIGTVNVMVEWLMSVALRGSGVPVSRVRAAARIALIVGIVLAPTTFAAMLTAQAVARADRLQPIVTELLRDAVEDLLPSTTTTTPPTATR